MRMNSNTFNWRTPEILKEFQLKIFHWNKSRLMKRMTVQFDGFVNGLNELDRWMNGVFQNGVNLRAHYYYYYYLLCKWTDLTFNFTNIYRYYFEHRIYIVVSRSAESHGDGSSLLSTSGRRKCCYRGRRAQGWVPTKDKKCECDTYCAVCGRRGRRIVQVLDLCQNTTRWAVRRLHDNFGGITGVCIYLVTSFEIISDQRKAFFREKTFWLL